MTIPRHLLCWQLWLAILIIPLCIPKAFGQGADSGQTQEESSSDRKPGITVIVDAAGTVQIIDKPGAAPRPARKGDQVPVDGSIVTGPNGRANLALSNGAFFQILENSSFSINEFEQSAYEFVFSNGAAIRKRELENFEGGEAVLTALDASEEAWNELPSEPTESNTRFSLDYGTMIGQSKKLKTDSEMEISTPIGVAGIRGTIWRFTIQPTGGDGSNRFRGNLDVSTGRVDFINREGTRTVQVQGGFGMNVEAVVEGGNVRIDSLATNRLSPERQQLLNSTVKEVANIQDAFSAIQGNPDVVAEVLTTLGSVDANNPQAVADAALSLMNGDGARAQLIAEVVTAAVIVRATPEIAPVVVSEVVSAMVTQSPNLAPNIVNGVVAASTNAGNRNIVDPTVSQTINRNAVDRATNAAPTQADAIRQAAENTEADRSRNNNGNTNRETGDTNQRPEVDKPSGGQVDPQGGTGVPNPIPPRPSPTATPAPTPTPSPTLTPVPSNNGGPAGP